MIEKTTYSKDELEEFKKIILAKIESAQDDLDVLRSATANDSDNGTEDTSPTFKQFEEGSSTLSKEENIKLFSILTVFKIFDKHLCSNLCHMEHEL